MFRDEFKARYTTIPLAIHRSRHRHRGNTVIPHQHKEIELIAMTAGRANFYINAERYEVKEGDVLVIPPYALHHARTRFDELSSHNCICFDASLLCDEALRKGLTEQALLPAYMLGGAIPHEEALCAYIEAACAACEAQGEGWEMEAVGRLSLLFSYLKKNGQFVPAPLKHTDNTFAKRALDYITAHYKEKITSSTAAEALYMNNSYFCHLFKKTFGYCFSDYLLVFRLDRAKVLLQSGHASVTDIAFQTGFGGSSYFGKAFKERFGLSPLGYRKKKRDNEK